ncbi:lipid A deacylase LpxR family protein [Nitrospina watsonii]|nr:lipid A deacylase LpxR family protein [Nitrospina watsonii]
MALFAPGLAAAQPGMDCPEYFFNATDANDFFAGLTDRHFTQGLRLSFVERRFNKKRSDYDSHIKDHCTPERLPVRLSRGVAGFFTGLAHKIGEATLEKGLGFEFDTASFILGHNIYTPEDLSKTGLVSRDRPYAGWFYIGFGFFDEKQDREVLGLPVDTLDSVEIDLGVIGPASGGERVQREWHALIDDEDPKGWDNQLHNEFALLISYDRKYRHRLLEENGMVPGVDWIPGGGVALGNVFTYVAAGGVVRVGYNLPADYGPPRIRPGTQGSDFFETGAGRDRKRVMAYLYTGLEGRAIAHNIFLDGNTFRTSHAVNKRYLVGDWQFGGALAYDCIRLAYTMVYRSQEFKGQFEPDIFGSMTLSVRF